MQKVTKKSRKKECSPAWAGQAAFFPGLRTVTPILWKLFTDFVVVIPNPAACYA
jgi:hypothetical protein